MIPEGDEPLSLEEELRREMAWPVSPEMTKRLMAVFRRTEDWLAGYDACIERQAREREEITPPNPRPLFRPWNDERKK